MLVKGMNGQVEFDGTNLTIHRKGFAAKASQGLKGSKLIPVGQIVSIQFKPATWATNGYIQFATAAGEAGGGLFDATSDENTVMFRNQKEFEELRDAVQASINDSTLKTTVGSSPIDQIKGLKELLDAGAISQEEFDAKKSALMDGI